MEGDEAIKDVLRAVTLESGVIVSARLMDLSQIDCYCEGPASSCPKGSTRFICLCDCHSEDPQGSG